MLGIHDTARHFCVAGGGVDAAHCAYVMTPPVAIEAEPFPIAQVQLLAGPFKEQQDVHARYLLLVEPDRLLAGFREQAGLPAKAKRYGGWESRDINGHSLGHYLSAIALMGLRDRVNYVVDELAACQQANGDGYVLPVPKKIYEDVRAGQIKTDGFGLNGVWVPNYTLHKVFAGLRDAYRYAGSKKALEVERKLADWLDGILCGLTGAQIQEMLKAEHGGMNEVLADLAADTGEKRYLKMAARDFHQHAVLDPLLRGEDKLNGLHGNTQIPKVIGLAREYELTGNPQYRRAAESFWDNVVNRRSFAIGGHGESEHFFPPEKFPEKLTPFTCETCNTYNMLKLTGHLFSWKPKAAEMDFVERAMINHLLANIGHQPGEFGYFLGLGSVGVKVFSTPFDSWWCCVGTGMENPARYGELIYFHNQDTLWVNLFIASELTWNGVTLRQETRFPEEDTIRFSFTCEKPVRFKLKLRKPYWCDVPEEALTFDRTWKTGDTLEVRLPMKLHFEPLPHSDGKIVAAMYGPMVLAGVVPGPLAKERFGDHLKARGKTDAFPPVMISRELKPTGRFAEFRSEGAVKPDDLTFVPFYRVYEEQYAVYFPVMTPAEWTQREAQLRAEKEQRARQEAATLDTVQPGFQQSEVEHNLRSENSQTGDFQDRKCREGSWFSYEMVVDPGKPMVLVATYWGGEWQTRNFDILIDGKKITTQKLRANKPGDFFDGTYAIPPALTKGKTKVTVRFQAHAGDTAGGVFDLRTLLAHEPETPRRQ